MRVTLNKKAYDFAKQMIHERKFDDKRGSGDVARAKPSNQQEEQFLKTHSWEEFGAWYLGAHYDRPENTRNRYEFPIGDFNLIHDQIYWRFKSERILIIMMILLKLPKSWWI